MSDIGHHLEGALPRQRPPGGVVGYVAKLEQFDDTMTASASVAASVASVEADPASPAPAEADPASQAQAEPDCASQAQAEADCASQAPVEAPPAVVAPADTAVIDTAVIDTAVIDTAVIDTAVIDTAVIGAAVSDTAVTGMVTSDAAAGWFAQLSDDDTAEFTIDWTVLANPQHLVAEAPLPDLSEPATGRAGAAVPGRRLRAAVLSCAALAVVAAGLGYAALNQQSPTSRGVVPPGVQESVPPASPDATFTTGVVPGINLARPSAPRGTPVPSVAVAIPGAPRRAAPGDRVGERTPDDPSTSPTPPWEDTPHWEAPPAQEPAQQPLTPAPPIGEPAVRLTATHFRSDEVLPPGADGYVTTVRIDNPGPADVTGWRVTMTVPGGDKLRHADGASVSHDGETVVFTPRDNATVPAGGSVSFTFKVKGAFAGDPSGCTINGHPCG